MESIHLSAISTITELEREIDTDSITYDGIRAWPLCRLKLWVHFMSESFKTMAGPGAPSVNNDGPKFENVGQLNAHVIDDGGLPLIHHDQSASQEALRVGTSSPELLFFVRPEEHGETVQGKAYAKILDSLFDRFPSRSRLKIEWAEPTAMGFARKNPSLFLHAELAARVSKSDPPHKLIGFERLEGALKDLSLDTALTRESGEHEMAKILWFSRLFDTVLTRLQPKAIFLSVYYHPLGMGLTLSARRQGIPIIDVQHGRLGPHHGLYTQLTAAPLNGYEIAPDRIWCWGEQTKTDIDIELRQKCQRHSGLVGGNPWFDLWNNGHGTSPDETAINALLERSEGKKRIIVSLQSLPQPLPKFVLEAMASAPADWTWWIRMHPLRRHTMPEVQQQLTALNINFEIEETTTLPLFWLLKQCDHHITSFSSVAIEALAFGLRTTVFSEAGKAAFQSYLNDGHVLFADNAGQLLETIAKALDLPPPHEESPFINSEPNLAELALDTILAN